MSNLIKKCGIFIDAENHHASVIPHIFQYILQNNIISVSAQAFGDFCSTSLSGSSYKKYLHKYAVSAQQCFNITKNSSDFSLTISAIDFLHENPDVDTYILASSDVDFLPLIIRLRRSNKRVIVFGSENANSYAKEAATIFITCGKHIEFESWPNSNEELLICTIKKAFYSNMNHINLADLGSYLSQNLGSRYLLIKKGRKLSTLIHSLGVFSIINDENGTSVVYQT